MLRFSRIENVDSFDGLVLDDVGAGRFELDAGFVETFAQNVKDVVQGGVAELLDLVVGERFGAAVGDVVTFVGR